MTLLIATPMRASEYGVADVKLGYHDAMRRLSSSVPIEEFPPSFSFGCDIVRARNRVASIIVQKMSKVDRVLWWDDDIWPLDVGIVKKMLDSGYDFVAAPYTNKQKPIRWIHEPLAGEVPDSKGWVKVNKVGFGFTMTSVKVLSDLSAESSKHQEWRPYWDEWDGGRMVPNIFGLSYEMAGGHELLRSEDYSLCRRWRDLGGDIYIYGGSGNILQHAGGHGFDAREIPGGVL
jgi:hypothetical protein